MLITEGTLPNHDDLRSRREALGLTHITGDDINILAYALHEQSEGGSLLYSFEQSLSMDLHIPVATLQAATRPDSVTEVVDALLTAIEEHRNAGRRDRVRAERNADRDANRLRAVWKRLGRAMVERSLR